MELSWLLELPKLEQTNSSGPARGKMCPLLQRRSSGKYTRWIAWSLFWLWLQRRVLHVRETIAWPIPSLWRRHRGVRMFISSGYWKARQDLKYLVKRSQDFIVGWRFTSQHNSLPKHNALQEWFNEPRRDYAPLWTGEIRQREIGEDPQIHVCPACGIMPMKKSVITAKDLDTRVNVTLR